MEIQSRHVRSLTPFLNETGEGGSDLAVKEWIEECRGRKLCQYYKAPLQHDLDNISEYATNQAWANSHD